MSTFKRGAIPTPRHKLLAAVPHLALVAPPPQFAVVPKKLDMWGNDQYGDCVSAEEAFAKAWWSTFCVLPETFVAASEVIRWAGKYGFLNGATLTDPMDRMKIDGLNVGGVNYKDGGYSGVNYADETILQSALTVGPVKIAIDADALPSTAGNQQGWFSTSGQHFGNTDHCVALSGYGQAGYLYSQLGVALPSTLGSTVPGYLLFTWSTLGFVTHEWLMGTCTEAWVRNPTTPGQSPGPAKVIVPGLVPSTWEKCQRALANVGLLISPASADPAARVIGQSPPQGTQVNVGSVVTVTLAAPVSGVKIVVSLADTKPGTVGTATVQ